jgi:hypothetical protein
MPHRTFTSPRFPIAGLVALIALLALAGCGTSRMSDPTGVGTEPEAPKLSPCACIEIPTRSGPGTL